MTAHASIHIGCKQLGIAEEDRRDLYERITGKRSLTGMSANEHLAVVSELKRLGFKPTKRANKKGLEGRYAPKLQALWIAAWNLGLVRNKSDHALLAFVKRQAKVDHTRFLRHKCDADKVIEALKNWMVRETGIDWNIGHHATDLERLPGYKIASTQWRILKNAGAEQLGFFGLIKVMAPEFNPFVSKNEDWIPIMNELGFRVRALGK